MIEADAAGIDEAAKRHGLKVQPFRSGGPWHWRMRMMSGASPLAIPLGVPSFAILGVLCVALGVLDWSSNPALAVGIGICGAGSIAVAAMLVFRRAPDIDIARRIWGLRDVAPEVRVATLNAWAQERLASDPGLYTATGLAAR